MFSKTSNTKIFTLLFKFVCAVYSSVSACGHWMEDRGWHWCLSSTTHIFIFLRWSNFLSLRLFDSPRWTSGLQGICLSCHLSLPALVLGLQVQHYLLDLPSYWGPGDLVCMAGILLPNLKSFFSSTAKPDNDKSTVMVLVPNTVPLCH